MVFTVTETCIQSAIQVDTLLIPVGPLPVNCKKQIAQYPFKPFYENKWKDVEA